MDNSNPPLEPGPALSQDNDPLSLDPDVAPYMWLLSVLEPPASLIQDYAPPTASPMVNSNPPLEPGPAPSWDNNPLSLDPDVDSDVWMQLLSVFEPSTTPTSLIQENALTTERSMRDPRATDAFATQELLNALPQFREEEGNYGPFMDNPWPQIPEEDPNYRAYMDNFWWPFHGAGRTG